MAKQSGLGARFYVGGYDISGDVQALEKVGGGPAALDVTDITQSAHSRLPGLRDGSMAFTSFFDKTGAHVPLSALPTADTLMTFLPPPLTVSSPAACLNAKQIGYDPARAADGSLTLKTEGQGSGYGLEWGVQLTPGTFMASNGPAGQNSTFEGGIGNWAAGSICTVAGSSAQAHSGSSCLALTNSGTTGTMTANSCSPVNYATQMVPCVAGQPVTAQAWVRAAVTARAATLFIDWYTSGGSSISSSSGASVTDSSSAWTLMSVTAQAPATAAFFRLHAGFWSAAGEVHYLDDVSVPGPGSFDTGGSLSFGAQAYLQVTAFTGTDATVAVQDSADNVTFTNVSGLSFTQITAAPAAQRIAIANTATVGRYVRAVVTTAAGFSALSFVVVLDKNPAAGTVF